MFAHAYQIARHYTKALITSIHHHDGTTSAGIAAFVIINEEGWIVTAAHVLEQLVTIGAAKAARDGSLAELERLREQKGLGRKERRTKQRALKVDPKWPAHWSAWCGRDGDVKIHDIVRLGAADLAIGRLEPFDGVDAYPVFKDPARALFPGTSLCRLGFPFHVLTPEYDEETGIFTIPGEQMPPTLFPIEGIYTRNLIVGPAGEGSAPVKFLETSSPGLKGQSGGPIFDTQGTVWSIQSATRSYELGFQPQARQVKKKQIEHQFLNVGLGAHPETLVAFLRDRGIQFQVSDY